MPHSAVMSELLRKFCRRLWLGLCRHTQSDICLSIFTSVTVDDCGQVEPAHAVGNVGYSNIDVVCLPMTVAGRTDTRSRKCCAFE